MDKLFQTFTAVKEKYDSQRSIESASNASERAEEVKDESSEEATDDQSDKAELLKQLDLVEKAIPLESVDSLKEQMRPLETQQESSTTFLEVEEDNSVTVSPEFYDSSYWRPN